MSQKQQYTELYDLAAKYQVISFDIFDTLLLRPFARWDHILNLVELELISVFGLSMKGYKKWRMQAMAECKIKIAALGKQEASLKEAIDEIKTLNDEQKQYALKLELETEEKHLKANSAFMSFVKNMREQGKRIIYCSDTYFPDDFIIHILQRENIWHKGDKLYTSLALQKNKAGGDLFGEVLKKEGLAAKDILHIGDNRRADYKMPKQHDISAYWLRNPISQDGSKDYSFLNLQKDKRGAYQTDGMDIMASMSLGLSNSHRPGQNKGLLFDLGYHVLAPLFLKICYDIKTLQNQQQNDIILFLARDGYILSKIYPLLFDDKCSYFPASRRFLCLPDANFEEFKSIILGGDRNRNIQNYLNGFPVPQNLIEALKQHFDGFEHRLTKKEFSLFRNIIKQYWPDIKQELVKEKTNLLKFFDQELSSYHKIMIFDLGWKGSLLKHLQKMMPHKTWNGYYFATLNGAIKNLNIHSFALNYGVPEQRNTLYFHNQELLELFFCEADESFEKVVYDCNTKQYIAQRSQALSSLRGKYHIPQEKFQEGIFAFIDDFKKEFSQKQQAYLINQINPLASLDRFIQKPNSHEAKVFQHIYHHSTTGSDYKTSFVQSGGLAKYRKSLWQQGSFALSSQFYKLIITIYNWQKKHLK